MSQNEKSQILQELIKSRRSVRKFSEEFPTKSQIEKVILMGLDAPFAGAAVGENVGEDNYFRRFFVISKDSAKHKDLEIVVDKHVKAAVKKMSSIPAKLISTSKKLSKLSDRLKGARLPDAPYIIIMAELNVVQSVAPQALEHVAENMWLMATAEGLGFQLVSIFESMKKNGELCKMLGIEQGAYSLLGCAIGVPKEKSDQVKRIDPKAITKWL